MPKAPLRTSFGTAIVGLLCAVGLATKGVSQPGDTPIISARDLATIHDMARLAVSPDGRKVAFVIFSPNPESNGYSGRWYSVDLKTKQALALADAGEMLPRTHQGRVTGYEPPPAPSWSPNGQWLAYLRKIHDTTQVWRVRGDMRGSEQLTHTSGDVRAAVFSRDGTKILFETEPSRDEVAASLDAEGRHGFLYDQRFQPMYDQRPALPRDVQLNAEGYARETQSQKAAQRVWVYSLTGGRERVASDTEVSEYKSIRSSPQPQSRIAFQEITARSPRGAIAWTEALDPNRQGYAPPITIVAQMQGAALPVICQAPECIGRMAGLWWRDDEELLFIRREGIKFQDRALYAWKPNEASAPRRILQTPDQFGAERFSDFDCAVARGQLLCLYEALDRPRRLVAIDPDNGNVETVFDPNPTFARFDLGPRPQRITVRAKSGAEIYGYLVLPPHYRPGQRLPLIVVTYRCSGFLRGGVGDEYPIYPFAAEGFAVFCYNLPDDLDRMARLSASAYSEWRRGPGVPMRRRIEQTLDATVDQLDRMGVIDSNRVAITGLSAGAEIVGFALVHMPRLAAAISSGNPGPGPGHYSLLGYAVRDVFRSLGVGAPEQTPERWREIGFSPNVSNVCAPLLINAADHEMLAALDPITALEDSQRSVEMYVFPNEYHIKWQPAHRLAIYNRNIDWMNFWLQGREDPAPAKAEQYERWRAMRVKQCELFGKEPDPPWYCRR